MTGAIMALLQHVAAFTLTAIIYEHTSFRFCAVMMRRSVGML